MAVVHTELQDGIDQLVGNPLIVALYRDWMATAGDGQLPPLLRFAPERQPAIAGNLMVLRPEGASFRYDYYGFRIASVAGFDMTGRTTSEFKSEVGDFFGRKYDQVLTTGRPLYTVHHASHVAAVVSWERLMLPVRTEDGGTVIVCYNVPLDRKAEVFDALMSASMDGIVVLQPIEDDAGVITDFRYLMVNPRSAEILGRRVSDLVGRPVSTAFPAANSRVAIYRQIMETGVSRQFEIEVPLDGTDRIFRLSAVRAGDKLVVTLSEITELRRLLAQLEQQQAELLYANETLQEQASNLVELVEGTEQARAEAAAAKRFVNDLMETVPIPLFHWGLDGTMVQSNSHYAAIYGHTPETIIGKRAEDLMPLETAERVRASNAALVSGNGDGRQVYEGDLHVSGRGMRHFVVHRALMRDPTEQPVGIAGAMLDLTDEYELRKNLERLAATDPLTGLFNRRVFMERLDEENARFQRYGHPAATVLLDVDHFKKVNDTLGHDYGDRVLIQLARLLRDTVREGLDIAARFGGEEFVLLLPDTDHDGAAAVAERLRKRFASTEFDTPVGPRHFSASFGVAGFWRGDDSARVLKRADEALYRSKEAGRDRVTIAPPPSGTARVHTLSANC